MRDCGDIADVSTRNKTASETQGVGRSGWPPNRKLLPLEKVRISSRVVVDRPGQ
jgi:hypothetical protein